MNITLLTSDIVARIRGNPDSVINQENLVANLIKAAVSEKAPVFLPPSPAAAVEALKETHRHMEELYRQAGEGRIVADGLAAARENAKALTDLIATSRFNPGGTPTRAS